MPAPNLLEVYNASTGDKELYGYTQNETVSVNLR